MALVPAAGGQPGVPSEGGDCGAWGHQGSRGSLGSHGRDIHSAQGGVSGLWRAQTCRTRRSPRLTLGSQAAFLTKMTNNPTELLFVWVYLAVFIMSENKKLKQFMNSFKTKFITY